MKKLVLILSTFVVLFGICSCSSVKDIPTDLSAAQLIQLGQNAYDLKNYKASEKYFLTAIQRYGANTYTYIEAQYELGHLYLATKQYKKAYNIFNEILTMYDYSFDLPAAYKKLATIGIKKIPTEVLSTLQKPE